MALRGYGLYVEASIAALRVFVKDHQAAIAAIRGKRVKAEFVPVPLQCKTEA